jgi:hypothetical protein
MSANAALIRSKLIRPGGSTITMADGAIITFKPDENGDHVAMVSNRDHINRLLSISEGYELHFGATPAPAVPVLSAPPKPVVTAMAQPVVQPAPLPPPVEPVAAVVAQPVADPTPVPENASDLASLTDDELKAVYRDEWKKEPHHKAKRETLIAQIEAIRAEPK